MRTILWFVKFVMYFLKVHKLEKKYLKKVEKGNFTKEDKLVIDEAVQLWAQRMLDWAGAECEVSGLENVPMDRAVLFTPNHQGNFDIPLVLSQLPRPYAMVSKKEMQKVPLISGWMHLLDCVFLDRGNARAAMDSMLKVENLLKEGKSVTIFPEGTRSKGDAQGEFKLGAMRSAIRGGFPIVPIAIEGTYRLMEGNGGWIRPANVKMRVLPAIETADMGKDESKKLAETVFFKIQEARNVLKNEH